jgi:hypothetical protein
MTSPLISLQSLLLLIAPGGVGCKIASKLKKTKTYVNILFSPSFRETAQPAVYNAAAHKLKRITLHEVMQIGFKLNEEIPLNNILWKPTGFTTKYQAWYRVNVILFHLIPGLLLDGLIKLSGNKPLYVNTRSIIYVNICI